MRLREIYRAADKIKNRQERIEFLKHWRDRHGKKSIPYKDLHAEVIRQMMAAIKSESRAA